MSPTTTHLPVVIVNYNTRELLCACLNALARSTGVALDVLVVDNASGDGSAEMVRREFPNVRLLAQSTNVGFAAANNVALCALGFGDGTQPPTSHVQLPNSPGEGRTASDYVLLLNPDTEVRPDALALLAAFLQAHPRAGAVGAQLIYADGRHQHSAFRFPGLAQTFLDFFPLHHRLRDSRLNGRYPQRGLPFEIDHPLGACILARGETIRQVGLMDEGFFMYVEEVDWCRRIQQVGWQIWCEPRALIVHHEGQATRQFREAMFVQLWRSRLRYFSNVHSPLYVACIRAIIRCGLWNEARKLARANISADERARRLSAIAEVRQL